MMAAIPRIGPDWAALWRQAGALMDVILHIGAHRTGTTTFQDYMRRNLTELNAMGTGFWGPRRTRRGVFAGILPKPGAATGRNLQKRGIGRVKLGCARACTRGHTHLVISDENMIGSVCGNLDKDALYPAVGERMARFAPAFEDQKTRVFLTIRALDRYWVSALGFAITRGRGVPDKADLDRLVQGRRSWRDVITDVACALPYADITVLPFENYVGQPDVQLALMTGRAGPATHARNWCNATPEPDTLRQMVAARGQTSTGLTGTERWYPFDAAQTAQLRETYLDDLFWLRTGADGLANFTQGTGANRTGINPAIARNARGHGYDIEKREMG